MARGIDNFNPGNIDRGEQWQGLRPDQTDPRFCQFIAPEWGIRAIGKILNSYAQEGIMTLRQAIDRWAPPVENDTGSYVTDVSVRSGIDPDITISLMEYVDVMPLVKAIIFHENGSQPYDQETIDKGLSLAGMEKTS